MIMASQTSVDLAHALDPLLQPRYRGLGAAGLLAYFRQRTLPSLPLVEDITQTTPEILRGVMHGQFCFNNETHTLGRSIDWRLNPSDDVEWQILLHKAYYLVGLARHWRDSHDDRYAARASELVCDWLAAEIPQGFIAADVDGRRIQNWVYAWSLLVHAPAFTAEQNLAMLERLHADVVWLSNNLHAKRNHRTLELFAVFLWAVAFPEFAAARDLRDTALAALTENALADFRPDGSHCEQSTHYHCIVLRNFINVVHLARENGIPPNPQFVERLRLAARFAAAVHRPDGEIPALSDADGGSYLDVIRMADTLVGPVAHPNDTDWFPDAGLVTIRNARHRATPAGEQCFMAFDAGPTGEGNHGHLDALSVEVYAHGSPLIVDPGRFTYDEGGEINWRAAFRGTRAHSTVMIDGKDQARYEPRKKKWKITGALPVTTLHGVNRLQHAVHAHGSTISSEYAARHYRHVCFFEDAYWLIIDLLQAGEDHNYDLRYQLGPDLADTTIRIDAQHVEAKSSLLACDVWATRSIGAELEAGWVSRQYGEKTAAPRLRVGCTGSVAAFATLLVPAKSAQRIERCSLSMQGEMVVFRHTNQTSGLSHVVNASPANVNFASQDAVLEPVR